MLVLLGTKGGGRCLCGPLLPFEYSKPKHAQYTQVIAYIDSEKVSPADSKYS
jgi:hypothetical protein